MTTSSEINFNRSVSRLRSGKFVESSDEKERNTD